MRIHTLTLVVLFVFCSVAFSHTLYVPSHYPTIQDGINATMNGDIVLVAPGTYEENIRFFGKRITLKSTDGAESTVIDGMQSGPVVRFQDGELSDAVLEGFTITNGSGDEDFHYYAPPLGGYYTIRGGGIYIDNARPTLRYNRIVDNEAYSPPPPGTYHGNSGYGAGLFLRNSAAAIEYNYIADNRFTGHHHGNDGGGIFLENSSPAIVGNTIKGHSTMRHAGGIDVSFGSAPIISGNVIAENTAGSYAGGIAVYGDGTKIHNNRIRNNTAGEDGGGIGVLQEPSNVMITGNTIHDNQALAGRGGGIHCQVGVLVNNLIFNNYCDRAGGGVFIESGVMTNNTLVNNTSDDYGGGLCAKYFWNASYGPFTVNMWNNICWQNHASDGPEVYIGEATTLVVKHCDFRNGMSHIYLEPDASLQWGSGNINADPLFQSLATGDFHLKYTSPCRDAGSNYAAWLSDYDFESDPRVAHGKADIGADEFHPHLYVMGDKTPGGGIEGKIVGLPGTSPVGLFIGSGVLPSALPTAWGFFYLQSPWLLYPLVPIPADGILVLPATVPIAPAGPYYIPMQALIGLDDDSLSNLEILQVE